MQTGNGPTPALLPGQRVQHSSFALTCMRAHSHGFRFSFQHSSQIVKIMGRDNEMIWKIP